MITEWMVRLRIIHLCGDVFSTIIVMRHCTKNGRIYNIDLLCSDYSERAEQRK